MQPPLDPGPGAKKKALTTYYDSMNQYVTVRQSAEYISFINNLFKNKNKLENDIQTGLGNASLNILIKKIPTGFYINLQDTSKPQEKGTNGNYYPYQIGHISLHVSGGKIGTLGAFHIHNDKSRKNLGPTHSKRYLLHFLTNGSLKVDETILHVRGIKNANVINFERITWQAISTIVSVSLPPSLAAPGAAGSALGATRRRRDNIFSGGAIHYEQFKELFLTLHTNDKKDIAVYVAVNEENKMDIIYDEKELSEQEIISFIEPLSEFILDLTDGKYVIEDYKNIKMNNSPKSGDAAEGGKRKRKSKTRKNSS